MSEKIKVLFYSSNPAATYGTSKVGKEISFRLANDSRFEIFFVSPDYLGIPYKSENGISILPVHPYQKGSKQWVELIASYINHLKPHVFLPFTDSFLLFDDGIHHLSFEDCHTRMLGYFNLDSITMK